MAEPHAAHEAVTKLYLSKIDRAKGTSTMIETHSGYSRHKYVCGRVPTGLRLDLHYIRIMNR